MLLVSVIVTVYHNVCQRYCNFTAQMVRCSKGWTSHVRFGGRNFTVALPTTFVTEWLVALSTSRNVFQFCFLSYDSDLQAILQKLFGSSMCFYWSSSLLEDVYSLFFECTGATVLVTGGFQFSLVALQQKWTLYLPFDGFPFLHFFFSFSIRLFLGVYQ